MVAQLIAGGSLRIPMCWQDYQALGETKHTEYYDGLAVVNPPSRRHVVIVRRLTRVLEDSVPAGYEVLPEFGWQPAPGTVFEPDVMVAATASPGADLLRVAPVLVVEVTSPSTRGEDLGRKLRAYADGGAPWYWVAEPATGVLTVYRLEGGRFVVEQSGGPGGRVRLPLPFAVDLDLGGVFA